MAPGASLGSNENGDPHLRQKPAGLPGVPSRLRPTGSSQVAQKRRFSGTIGSAITASAGSRAGTEAISTSPAPRRWPVVDRVRLVADRRADVSEVAVGVLEIAGSGAGALG